jgi:hypothetical protein
LSIGAKACLLIPERERFISILANSSEGFLLRDDHGSGDCTIPECCSRTLPSLGDEVRVAVQRHAAGDVGRKEIRGLFPTQEMPSATHPQPVFPHSTRDSILAFQFSSWYPRFRQISVKSTIIRPLEDSFREYLDSDGVFVPDGSENG